MDNTVDSRFERAVSLLESERFSEAVEAFTDFLLTVPESESAFGNRGIAFARLGEDEKAIEDFRSVISINPADAMGHAMLAVAMRNLGNYEEALAHAVESMELDEDEQMAYLVRGWLFARAGQYQFAVDDLTFYCEQADAPDEYADLLEICRMLAAKAPTAFSGEQLDSEEKVAAFLSEQSFSFDFSYNSDYECQHLPCPYAHCIRNMPRRCHEAVSCCPTFAYECPGGEKQAMLCRRHPLHEA